MHRLEKIFKNPYVYIFLASYFGIWLIWNCIRLPFANPGGIISYLPSIQYNPTNNLLRFLVVIFLPPLACLVYWLLVKNKTLLAWQQNQRLHKLFSVLIVCVSLLLCVAMGIVHGSTNPSNNPVGVSREYAQLDSFHEGEALGQAISYEQNDLKPYRDFVFAHGVFQDPLRAVLAFKLFGHSIGAVRAFSVILFILTFLLLYLFLYLLLQRSVIKTALALSLFALLLLPSATLFPPLSHLVGVQLPFRDIATLLFLIFTLINLRSVIRKQVITSMLSSSAIGFIVTAGFANSIDRAMYITALSILWLLFAVLISNNRKYFGKAILLPSIIGALVGLVVLGLALKWAFGDFISFLLSVSRYKEYVDGIEFQQPNLAISVILILVSASLTIAGGRLVTIWHAARGKTIRQKVKSMHVPTVQFVTKYYAQLLLLAASLVFLRSAIGRALIDHFAYSIQWLYILVISLIVTWLYKSIKPVLAVYITVLVLGFTGIYFAAWVKDIDITRDTFPIHIKDKDLVRKDHLQTADFLKKNLHGSETFVTLTSEGSWYYLVDKPSPVKYPVVWFAFLPEERQNLARSIQQNNNIKFIVTNNNWTSSIDSIPNNVRLPEVYTVLGNEYKPYKGFGQQTVWIRE